jgi:CDP-glucose 4,6-dehydratase
MKFHRPNHFWKNSVVLVTGATGLVGSRLVRALLDLKAQVVCLVRDADPASPLWFSGDVDCVCIELGLLEVFEHI